MLTEHEQELVRSARALQLARQRYLTADQNRHNAVVRATEAWTEVVAQKRDWDALQERLGITA